MLPLNFLLKMPNFEVTMNGEAVKVTLIEHGSQVDNGIAELRRLLKPLPLPLVGLDLKAKHTPTNISSPSSYSHSTIYEMLILQVEGYCLLINFKNMDYFPTSLSKLLSDNTICFVGLNMDNHRIRWCGPNPFFVEGRDIKNYEFVKTGVNIQYLAAKALKDPSLRDCSLKTMATKNGFDYVEDKLEALKDKDLGDFCFSDEDVKRVISQAYMCYTLGAFAMNKLA